MKIILEEQDLHEDYRNLNIEDIVLPDHFRNFSWTVIHRADQVVFESKGRTKYFKNKYGPIGIFRIHEEKVEEKKKEEITISFDIYKDHKEAFNSLHLKEDYISNVVNEGGKTFKLENGHAQFPISEGWIIN